MLKLRSYQERALDASFKYWSQGGDNPLVVMATGTGKSLVQATMAQRLIGDYSGLRVVSITHVQELIEQNYKELLGIWPFAPAGMYSAGLNARDINSQILFGGIQSLHERVAELGHVDLLMVDEAHLIPRNADTMYGRFILELLKINPEMRVIGFTATPYRTDSGRLDEGEPRIFDRVIFEYGIADGIKDGFLSPLVSKDTATTFDLDGVKRRGGEYVPGSLQAACDKEETTRQAVEEIVAAGQNRKSWLAFCAGVEHAIHVRDEIRRHGIRCETISGDTPKGERRQILADYKAGKIRALTNNSVLTTGFNAPGVDLIAGLRPTLSTGLYVQIAGRGTRLADGKKNCLYLDFAGNVRRHGPVDCVEPRKPGKGDGEAPVKVCQNCRTFVHISAKECPECGNPFEMKETPKHTTTADVLPILRSGYDVWWPVTRRTFTKHVNKTEDESVRVDFLCRFKPYKMWLSIAKSPGRANRFWRDHGGGFPAPTSVDEWLARQGELKPTAELMARPSSKSKFIEIVGIKPMRADNDNNTSEGEKNAAA